MGHLIDEPIDRRAQITANQAGSQFASGISRSILIRHHGWTDYTKATQPQPPWRNLRRLLRSEAIMSADISQDTHAFLTKGAKGISGNTIADLREVAAVWDKSASYCDECGEPELASRDRRFASAMREAANILSEKENTYAR